ncbi:macrolide-inactivating glycosyltransferase [Kutzneria viridogrisea]|uniref:MGT family glycosyltransferase n=1 Tax=Kutzneria viridogrisea TaxID=47990 RepID=A0ABR6BE86_9PSEU|nr:MGT family glycosyltransferase [Kutzneria viridogrisea]
MPEKSLHVAFMAVPAHGHVNPGLGLVTELAARGHRVTYAINEEFAPQVRAAGAEPVLYTSTFPSFDKPEADVPEEPAAGMTMFLDEFEAVLPQVEAAYEADRPDVLVYDIGAWQAPVLAERWGIPAIQLSGTYVGYEGVEEDLGWTEEMRTDPAMVAFTERFAAYVASLDVSLTVEDLQAKPRRCIVTIPKSFQLRGERVADSYTFVGPMLTERSTQGDWRAPDERPVLLITLGSAYTNQPEFFRMCLEAFADNGWHVVMSVGRFVDPASLGEVPSNFDVRQWVPQALILRTARAFITHAGMGGTMEGLANGVPLIAVPQATDQLINGPRIAELGLGAHIPREEVTVRGLREALHAVTTDPAIAANLAAMRAEIASAGGVTAAADLVESEVEEWKV